MVPPKAAVLGLSVSVPENNRLPPANYILFILMNSF